MDLLDVIKNPIITEKSMSEIERKKYVFKVDVRANKTLIKQALKSIFDIEIKKINIINVHSKFKRVRKYVGQTKKYRKAIVTLTQSSKAIEIFPKDSSI